MNNSQEQRKNLLEGNIPKLVMKMAIPSMVIQIITLVYNTVDTYFISQINKSAAAAIGTVFSIQAIIQAVGFGIGMGVSSLCSRRLGEAKDDEANCFATSGVFLAICVSAIIGIGGLIFLTPLLKFIGCTPTMLAYGKSYISLILIFAPLACTNFVLGNIFKSEGHLKYGMYGNVAGSLLNGALDPLFIFTFGWGTFGAALATILGYTLTLFIYWSHFYRKKMVIRLSPKFISKKWETYQQIITTGLPTIFRQGLGSLATALLCKSAAVYGDAAVAAVTISNKCYMLVRNVVLGIGQGAQPVAGYNYGAKLYKRAKASYDFTMKVGTGICLVSATLLYLFAKNIMWWFCKDMDVLEFGVPALHYASMVIPVMAVSTYVNQEYQCLGFKKQATFLASCRQGICFIPIILILPHFIGVTGIEMAQPLADFFTFIISIPFYFLMAKKLTSSV